ncbi:hypothetical protein GJ744_006155 [Endocarpon pusillum]|uniref:Uncharacterized protein n=1 Tax=Endocarpon pusillum TaxID=364733 RepID=A0A8H7DYE9_9EURO|nr:hypothetical protein GJ744_006155 [Endocarpon pusillum]
MFRRADQVFPCSSESSDESRHTSSSSPFTSSSTSSSGPGTPPPFMRTGRPATTTTTTSQITQPRQPAEPALTRQARRHPGAESTAKIYIRVLDRTDGDGRPLGRFLGGARACKFAIQPDMRVNKYTVYGLSVAANGALRPDLVDDSQSLDDDGQHDNAFRVVFVSHLPGQRVQELQELVLRAAGRERANSESWVRSCLEKMRNVGMMTERERVDAMEKIVRAGRQK